MNDLHQRLYCYVMETQYKTLNSDEEYRKVKAICVQAEDALTASLTPEQQEQLQDFITKYNAQIGYESEWVFEEGLSLIGKLLRP